MPKKRKTGKSKSPAENFLRGGNTSNRRNTKERRTRPTAQAQSDRYDKHPFAGRSWKKKQRPGSH